MEKFPVVIVIPNNLDFTLITLHVHRARGTTGSKFYQLLPEKDHTAIGSTLVLVLRGSVGEFTVTVTIVFMILFLSFSSGGA